MDKKVEDMKTGPSLRLPHLKADFWPYIRPFLQEMAKPDVKFPKFMEGWKKICDRAHHSPILGKAQFQTTRSYAKTNPFIASLALESEVLF